MRRYERRSASKSARKKPTCSARVERCNLARSNKSAPHSMVITSSSFGQSVSDGASENQHVRSESDVDLWLPSLGWGEGELPPVIPPSCRDGVGVVVHLSARGEAHLGPDPEAVGCLAGQ